MKIKVVVSKYEDEEDTIYSCIMSDTDSKKKPEKFYFYSKDRLYSFLDNSRILGRFVDIEFQKGYEVIDKENLFKEEEDRIKYFNTYSNILRNTDSSKREFTKEYLFSLSKEDQYSFIASGGFVADMSDSERKDYRKGDYILNRVKVIDPNNHTNKYCSSAEESNNCLRCVEAYEGSSNCVDCWSIYNCKNCKNCIGIANGVDLKYVVRGIQLTKEEYFSLNIAPFFDYKVPKVSLFDSGKVKKEEFIVEGKFHRDQRYFYPDTDFPAVVEYNELGEIVLKEYWHEGIKYDSSNDFPSKPEDQFGCINYYH